MRGKEYVIAAALLFLTSCAGYSIEYDPERTESGYHVFMPTPYLIAEPVAVDGSQSDLVVTRYRVIFLPDYTRPYAIDTWSLLGAGHFQFTIEDGWKLVAIDADVKETELARDVLQLLGKVTGLNKGRPTAAVGGSSRPGLFKLVYDAKGKLRGLRQVEFVGDDDSADQNP